MSLFELPPQQMKKELLKKIDALQAEITRKQKEREGLLKLKEIYSTNQKFGDSQAATDALKTNDDKLTAFNAQLKKYQDILNELESNASYYSSSSNHYQQSQSQQHYATTNEYALSTTSNGSSTSSNGSSSGTTLPRCDLKSQNIYQSPSEHSVNSNGTSLPGTPMSYHSNAATTTVGMALMNNKSNTIGAYAVSSVAGKVNGNGGKMAPMASSDRNESFDDEDDELEEEDEEEDEEEYEETYEKPMTTAAATTTTTTTTVTNTATAAAAISIVSNGQRNSLPLGSGGVASESPNQYDHVDAASLVQEAQDTGAGGLQDGAEDEPVIGTALVMYSFAGTVQNAMSIQENESLNVLERDSGDGWTLVKRLNGEKGYVPTDYIQIVYY